MTTRLPPNQHKVHQSAVMWCGQVSVHHGAYFTKEVNQSLAKPPLNFNGGLAKLWLSSVGQIGHMDLVCP